MTYYDYDYDYWDGEKKHGDGFANSQECFLDVTSAILQTLPLQPKWMQVVCRSQIIAPTNLPYLSPVQGSTIWFSTLHSSSIFYHEPRSLESIALDFQDH